MASGKLKQYLRGLNKTGGKPSDPLLVRHFSLVIERNTSDSVIHRVSEKKHLPILLAIS